MNAATWSQIFCLQTAPTPVPGVRVKGQSSTLSEHDHVAYQIKGNHKCSNLVANILPADPPSSPAPPSDPRGQKVKIQLL